MTTFNSQDQPSDAEFDQMISGAHHKMHRVMRVEAVRGQQRRTRLKIMAAGMVTLAVAGGGAAVANVGPFASAESGNYSNVQGPVGVDGKPATGSGENAITSTTWPKNEFGLTFGEPTRADVLARNLPVLMPVITQDGEPGFWRSDEAYVYTSAGDVETVPKHLTVYGPDGKTLVAEK